MRNAVSIISTALSFLFIFSAAAAKDEEWVRESNNCIVYHKHVRHYWWSDRVPYEINLSACGEEKQELMEDVEEPEELWS